MPSKKVKGSGRKLLERRVGFAGSVGQFPGAEVGPGVPGVVEDGGVVVGTGVVDGGCGALLPGIH